MVGTKIKMSRKEHGNGYVVQSRRWHGVRSFEDGVEVVSEPVIPDKTIDCQPDVSFGGIALFQGS